jgi:DNA-binding CsgD family transcriptional regulator
VIPVLRRLLVGWFLLAPRRPSWTGADALTASERRIARLAAEGRSNLEIAQELYVGLKTVEAHLSHAYSKLGLTGQGSRQRLADPLGAGSAIARAERPGTG